MAAGLAISEEPETTRWIETAREKFRLTDAALGSDGASHEGACYWSYGTEYMLKFWALSSDLWSEDLRSPWWSKTALYRIYIGVPQLALAKGNMVVDIGDCTRQEGYGPDYQLFNLAHRTARPGGRSTLWVGRGRPTHMGMANLQPAHSAALVGACKLHWGYGRLLFIRGAFTLLTEPGPMAIQACATSKARRHPSPDAAVEPAESLRRSPSYSNRRPG